MTEIIFLDENTLVFILWLMLFFSWYISENDMLSIAYSILLSVLSLYLINTTLQNLSITSWLIIFIFIAIPVITIAHSIDSLRQENK